MSKTFNITGCMFLILYLGITIGVYTESQWVNTLDLALIDLFQGQVTETGTDIVSILTDIGGGRELAAITIVLMVFMLIRKVYIMGVWLGATVLMTASVLTSVMKSVIGRERPDIMVLASEQSLSFPSGHTTAATVFYGLAGLSLILIVKTLWQRIIIITAATILIAFVMFSRIYLGVHYPTDVLGGLCFGMASIFISIGLYQLALPHLQKFLLKWNLQDNSPSLNR
ncbi:phosphatase PAP2 family protein [Salinicoccus albus]|uniref:phosphatase PAP2 family protein n=1 Tax=Salinicoccus albus TaxID=418756 RepID=UPI00037A8EA6|nr:phosphatase PAP2 family protein [Salinicoccus albus]